MEKTEIAKIVEKNINEAFKEFQTQIKEQVEHEFKNGERIAKFLTKLEERQKTLCNCLEELTKTTKELLEALKKGKGGRISYAS